MKRTPHWKTVKRWKASGQALILIVLTFFGMLIFLGLMVDLGQIFLAKGYLRRAADAAALAAAAQFRENRPPEALRYAAEEAAQMNGINPDSVIVDTCATALPSPDPVLCEKAQGMPKKLVRVTIILDYPMTFLSLLGPSFGHVTLTETSISEAASMDVVLVIDISESMAWEGAAATSGSGDPDHRDPSVCNADKSCMPFEQVRSAAKKFVDEVLQPAKALDEEEDRVAIVTIGDGWHSGKLGTIVAQDWTHNNSTAISALNALEVYNPDPAASFIAQADFPDPVEFGPYRYYSPKNPPVDPPFPLPNGGDFWGFNCLRTVAPEGLGLPSAYSACGTTNIGGGLYLAGQQFAIQKRPQALWVVVLLTDGAADATFGTQANESSGGDPTVIIPGYINPDTFKDYLPLGYCPDGDWVGPGEGYNNRVYCQDGRAGNYNSPGSGKYDANDWAIDEGKFVACPAVLASPATGCGTTKGQGAVIFTIGLGTQIVALDDNPVASKKKPYGGTLLRYLAAVGDDGNPDTDLCTVPPAPAGTDTDWTKNCGNYFWGTGSDLQAIFEKIYSRIFTRLTV